jgi:hypothetical protein
VIIEALLSHVLSPCRANRPKRRPIAPVNERLEGL